MTLEQLFFRALVVSLSMKLVFVGLGFLVARLPSSARLRVYRVTAPANQLLRQLKPALLVVALDAALIFVFRAAFHDRFVGTGWISFVATFAWMFVAFEAWFYASHRLLHTKRFYRFHAQHHVAHVVDPLTSLSFSVVERAVLMVGALGLGLLGTMIMPMSDLGMLSYVAVNYALNVLGHSNVERLPRTALFYTPTFHAMHHARFEGHYGLFTTVLDRVFGTAWADYPQVHARARAGLGLERLGERLPVELAPADAPAPRFARAA